MLKRIITTIVTLTVLMGSVVACGGSDQETATATATATATEAEDNSQVISAIECVNPDAPKSHLEGRRINTGPLADKIQLRWTDVPVPIGEQTLNDDKNLSPWITIEDDSEIDELISICTLEPLTQTPTVEPAPRPTPRTVSINVSQCKSDLQAIADNLYTYDDDYYDRLFKRSLSSCGNESTWRQYAPSSIANQLTATCMLYSSYSVCRN